MSEHRSNHESFIVLSVFTSAPELRGRFVNLIDEFATTHTRLEPGICSVELFTDEGSEHIVTLVRWKDRESFEQFKRSDSGVQASQVALTLRPKIYFLRMEHKITRERLRPAQVGG